MAAPLRRRGGRLLVHRRRRQALSNNAVLAELAEAVILTLSFSGGFCPVSLSLFHGTRLTLPLMVASMRQSRWAPPAPERSTSDSSPTAELHDIADHSLAFRQNGLSLTHRVGARSRVMSTSPLIEGLPRRVTQIRIFPGTALARVYTRPIFQHQVIRTSSAIKSLFSCDLR